MSIQTEILKMGNLELYNRNKISLELKNETDDYIDLLSLNNILEIEYEDFNQIDSENVVFTESTRTVTLDTGMAILLTNKLDLVNVKLLALKLKGSDENVIWKISSNGSNYHVVDSSDINELVVNGVYVRVDFSEINSITGIIAIYENL
jgi:hypothetical protein